MRPLLVGEDNPYGGDPRYALYPEPRNCAGDRLCRLVMGLTSREYLARFDRANLCAERWSVKEAHRRAAVFLDERPEGVFVLLGAKVAAAFERASGFAIQPSPFLMKVLEVESPLSLLRGVKRFVFLPHPSGRCRAWNEPGAFDLARSVLRVAGVLPELAPA